MTTTTNWMESSDMLCLFADIKRVAPKAVAATIVIMEKDEDRVVYRTFNYPQAEEFTE